MSKSSGKDESRSLLPSYVNDDYIKKAVEQAFDGGVKLHECAIKLISTNGENFCSDIYRVKVKFRCLKNDEEVESSLILKVLIPELATFGSSENFMFAQILPEMERILKNLGKPTKLHASCYMNDRIEKEVFVLEDLNTSGYETADRFIGLDFIHAKKLLEKIAEFHASSMIFIKEFPKEAEFLQSRDRDNDDFDPISHAITFGGMTYVKKMIENWEDFEEIAAKLDTNIKKFDERMQKVLDPNSEQCKVVVINHADLWVNNFLYSHRDGMPTDVVFVDFQNCFLGSPGCDLNYFLYTSVQLEVLKTKRFELLRHYYKSLKATLMLSDSVEVPTWQIIMEEVRQCAFMGLYAALCELPLCCVSPEASKGFTTQTLKNTEEMAEKRKLMYGSKRVQETLAYTLDYFNELGVLDYPKI